MRTAWRTEVAASAPQAVARPARAQPRAERKLDIYLGDVGDVVERTAIALDANGVGSVTTAEIAGTSVTAAVLVLTNASTRFTACWRDRRPPFFSCLGTPLDDADYRFRAFAGP